jgi:hypothetical protein
MLGGSAAPATGWLGGVAVPSRPGPLVLLSTTKTSLRLSWPTPSSGVRVLGYRVYVNGKLRASVRSAPYVVGQLSCGKTYTVAVSAYDAAGKSSRRRSRALTTSACAPSSATTNECTTTIVADLVSAIRNAPAGATICLAAGEYGDISLTSVGKSDYVTVQPSPGADVVICELVFRMVSHLRLRGSGGSLSIGGLYLDPTDGDPTWSHDLVFDHVTWTAGTTVRTRGSGQAILFDSNVFDNLPAPLYEGRISVRGYDNSLPVGVTIRNSHFSGGCSDGVQVVGDAYGVQIGPGNEFTGFHQSGCAEHVDPIQLYGSRHTLITGNWFHDNGDTTGGVAVFDGGDHEMFTNNVLEGTGYPSALAFGSCLACVATHNVFLVNNADWGHKAELPPSTGGLSRDNIFTAGAEMEGEDFATVTEDYNLCSRRSTTCDGSHDVYGRPVFVGGSNPTMFKSRADYRLAPGSPGKNAASDGSDMGIRLPG